jgi:hypothetical protein
MPSIVQLVVSQTLAATPNTLQKTGAFISQGATTLASGTYSLLTQASSLTPLLVNAANVSGIVWAGGTVTVTTSSAITGVTTGDKFLTTLAGFTPAGYNGTYVATVTGAETFTFALATNPGVETVLGTYTPNNVAELVSMNTTFFAQGGTQAVYVLELGAGDGNTGPTALASFTTTNPGIFYSYLTPRNWDATANYLAMLANYNADTAQTYFFTTTTAANYNAYSATFKCNVRLLETPTSLGRPINEFSAAAGFYVSLNYAPSSTNPMTQFCYTTLSGVTAYPTFGNSAFLTQVLAANCSYIGSAIQGGLNSTILWGGTTGDGEDFTWWYSADWIQIQSSQTLANVVINGSQQGTPNPLYYNQPGINTLQDAEFQLMGNGISYGLGTGTVARSTLTPTALATAIEDGAFAGQCVINAVPFPAYVAENPLAYGQRTYGGLTCIWIPQNGFRTIVFQINVTNLLTA